MKSYITLLIFSTMLLSCTERTTRMKEHIAALQKIEIPLIPEICETPEQQAEFIAAHYWDNFDFGDTTYIGLPDITEQAFADYIHILDSIPIEISANSLRIVFDKASVNQHMYSYFFDQSEKYLYDARSTTQNEELYIVALEHLLASEMVGELEKIRPRAHLEMVLKNRLGHRANDFTYTLANGSKGTLHGIDTDYTILYVNNPGCVACAKATELMFNSDVIMPLVESGRLTILSIYPDDDLQAWRRYAENMPPQWINAYDAELRMRGEDLYDLKAIPTLYLLDRDKRVLIKDAAYPIPIEEYLREAGS